MKTNNKKTTINELKENELFGRKIPGLNPTDISKTIDLCT